MRRTVGREETRLAPAPETLRVLHVIGGGDTGGAMAHVLPLLGALREQGCDARLLCLGEGGLADAAAAAGLPVRVLPMGSAWDARVVPSLRRALGGPWHVVHTHGMRANLPVRLLRLAAADGCLFTTVHSDLALDYADPVRGSLYTVLDRLTRRGVDVFVCVSEDLRRRLLARGLDPRRVVVVRSGLEAATAIDQVAAAPTALVDRLWRGRQPAAGVPRVGTVARLVAVKDLALFLEVVARLHELFPGLRAAIVGEGPERPALDEAVRRLGLERVVDLPGELRPARSLLAELDVYLVTSVSEGVPVAVLEAMDAGLPVVATAVGGLGEAVEEGLTGYLVARSDDRVRLAAALASAVTGLLRDEGLRRRLGAAGARRVAECFTTERTAAALLAAYRRCVAARSERS